LLGVFPRQTRWVTVVLLTAFFGISLNKTLAGEASCGCFGPVVVPPWVMAIVDAIAVLVLVVVDLPARTDSLRPTYKRLAAFGALGLAVLAVMGTVAYKRTPVVLDADGSLPDDAVDVVLEPASWIQQHLPIHKHVDIGDAVMRGRWVIVL